MYLILTMEISYNELLSLTKCFTKSGKCIVACSKEYYRPLEVDTLLGDPTKAKKKLNWKAKTGIKALVKEMVKSELLNLK